MNMLEFAKKIVKAVSFDAKLFQKELVKAINRFTDLKDLQKFQNWCIEEFGKVYPTIIKTQFNRELIPIEIRN